MQIRYISIQNLSLSNHFGTNSFHIYFHTTMNFIRAIRIVCLQLSRLFANRFIRLRLDIYNLISG